jgi:hypothetical protein
MNVNFTLQQIEETTSAVGRFHESAGGETLPGHELVCGPVPRQNDSAKLTFTQEGTQLPVGHVHL